VRDTKNSWLSSTPYNAELVEGYILFSSIEMPFFCFSPVAEFIDSFTGVKGNLMPASNGVKGGYDSYPPLTPL